MKQKTGADREITAVRHPEIWSLLKALLVKSMVLSDKPVWNSRDFCRTVSLFQGSTVSWITASPLKHKGESKMPTATSGLRGGMKGVANSCSSHSASQQNAQQLSCGTWWWEFSPSLLHCFHSLLEYWLNLLSERFFLYTMTNMPAGHFLTQMSESNAGPDKRLQW